MGSGQIHDRQASTQSREGSGDVTEQPATPLREKNERGLSSAPAGNICNRYRQIRDFRKTFKLRIEQIALIPQIGTTVSRIKSSAINFIRLNPFLRNAIYTPIIRRAYKRNMRIGLIFD
jgi:hypothetical protein